MNATERAVIREACQQSLMFFTRYMFKARTGHKFIVSKHHEMIVEHLEAVARCEILNSVINMPPRYGKTELAVINFIPWCFVRNDASKFIHLSYAEKLVLDNSSQIRDLMKSREFQELWPIDFKQDTDAKSHWKVGAGGSLYATASGGSVTGFGAGSTQIGKFSGAILIDDPLKPDDASSDVERPKINERLVNTIMSRRNSRETPIILIMQRLHEEDMTGFIKSGATGEHWEHLKLPALDDKGAALWPMKHTANELRAMQAANPLVFSGQYMQEPAPPEGTYFLRDWLRTYDKAPPLSTLHVYGASDYAVTADGGDYTVHIVIGVDPDDNMYVLDLWRQQAPSDVWVESLLDMVDRWKPIEWAEETGQIRAGVGPLIDRRSLERRSYVKRTVFPTRADKAIRAQAMRGRMAGRGLYLPISAPWRAEFMRELLVFPAGKHDDQVDALGLIGQLLEQMQGKRKPPVAPSPSGLAFLVQPNGTVKSTQTFAEILKQQSKRRRSYWVQCTL